MSSTRSASDAGGQCHGEILPDVSAAVAGHARRLKAAGAPLAGALLGTLAAAADGAALLPDDEYDTLMTAVASWVIEAYADEG